MTARKYSGTARIKDALGLYIRLRDADVEICRVATDLDRAGDEDLARDLRRISDKLFEVYHHGIYARNVDGGAR